MLICEIVLSRNKAETSFVEEFNVRCQNEFDCEGRDGAKFSYLTNFLVSEKRKRVSLYCVRISNFQMRLLKLVEQLDGIIKLKGKVIGCV